MENRVTEPQRITYYKTARVGNDIIENAKYFVLRYDKPNSVDVLKDKLEDLANNFLSPFRRVKHKFKNLCWNIRYGFQRMFKGYDSVDVFDTFSKFIDRYIKVLTEYKKSHYCSPFDMSGDEWDNIIDEMIYHLRYMDENNVMDELKRDIPEDWIPSYKTVNEIMCKHKDEFFKLFSEHFYSLWD